MGMLNRIVNITVLVLAIVSVVFGCLLFQKREALRGRGDNMADFIVELVKIMDVNSAADGSKNITAGKLELDAKKAPNDYEKNAKKTLYHNNYGQEGANLKVVLAPVRLQTENILKQRDFLGTALTEVGTTLELKEQFPQAGFQGLPTYQAKKTQLMTNVQKVNARDNKIIEQIAASATVMGFTVDPNQLKDLDGFNTPLSDFASKVEKLKKRSDAYGEHIASVCKIFGVSTPSLGGEDYGAELTNASKALQNEKNAYEETKKQLAMTKEKLAAAEENLNLANQKIEGLNKDIEKMKQEVASMKKKMLELLEGVPDADIIYTKLEGKILQVNNKWDYVIIDLGKLTKMTVGEGKKKKEIIVPLPEGKTMMVTNGESYVAKVKVTKVNDNTAICDILPDLRNGTVSVGDKVFFAPMPPAAPVADAAAPGKAGKAAGPAAAVPAADAVN
ncbi:MAG TPA: hypothetical protein DCZ94_18575 [Lentisphaeria bacterium]|nr:MAG: hypothetical protein A2X48_24135 [Lentisphaerae bacterium GWF2_49_21]HBC88952.1 hypothetical protein [Lentisphaeria bacterium]